MKLNQLIHRLILFPTLTLLMNGTPMLWAQTSQSVSSSGKKFMVPKKEVNGKWVGQEDVLIEEVVISDSGRQYRRLDVGVTGTLEGWIVKEGPRSDHLLLTLNSISLRTVMWIDVFMEYSDTRPPKVRL